MPKWRLKNMTYSKTSDDLGLEFRKELGSIVEKRILDTFPPESGILGLSDHRHRYGQLIYVEEKMKLIDAWEKSGRKTSFLSESIGDLIYQKREIISRMPAEDAVKWMIPGIDIEAIKAQHAQEKRTTP